MKKWISAMCAVVCGMMVSGTFVSCDKEGKDSSGITGWYFEGNSPVIWSDFQPINRPDMVEFTDGGQWYPYHIWVDYCYEAEKEGLFHLVQTGSPKCSEFIHIVNDNVLEYYYGYAYKFGASGTVGQKLLYKFNNKDWGMMGFYAFSPINFVYTRDGDNIVITYDDEKTVFAITDDGLIQNGAGKWTKYDIDKVY